MIEKEPTRPSTVDLQTRRDQIEVPLRKTGRTETRAAEKSVGLRYDDSDTFVVQRYSNEEF